MLLSNNKIWTGCLPVGYVWIVTVLGVWQYYDFAVYFIEVHLIWSPSTYSRCLYCCTACKLEDLISCTMLLPMAVYRRILLLKSISTFNTSSICFWWKDQDTWYCVVWPKKPGVRRNGSILTGTTKWQFSRIYRSVIFYLKNTKFAVEVITGGYIPNLK